MESMTVGERDAMDIKRGEKQISLLGILHEEDECP